MNKYDWLHQGGMISTILLVSICVINCGYLFEGSFKPLGDFHFQTMLFTGHDSLKDIPPDGANRFANTWIGKIPVLLPANMVQGIDTQRYDFERGLPSYLRGQWADHGWWYYYLYALLVKVPLGTWVLFLLAVGVTIFGRGFNAAWRDEMMVLAPGVVILAFVSSQTGFSVHSRYVIPALPFFFVWMSKVGRVFEMKKGSAPFCRNGPELKNTVGRVITRRETDANDAGLHPGLRGRRVLAAAVAAALCWSVASSLSVYPHSLSYFNELAAVLPTPADYSYPKPKKGTVTFCRNGPEGAAHKWALSPFLAAIRRAIDAGPRNGPRHLLDSNIDWGQDLFYLKDWLDEHPEATLDGLAYHGSYPAALAGIPETPQPPPGPYQGRGRSNFHEVKIGTVPEGHAAEHLGPKPGWYALSVNYIYGRDQQYRYFLNFQPAAMAGYSIYIYHITPEDAESVWRELGL